MNEKFCSRCGTKNPAEMIFCLNCGNNLPASGSPPNFSGESAPTVFAPAKVTHPTGFQPTPLMPPQQKKSGAGFYLAVFGGIGLIFILLFGGIIGLVAINWDKITGEDDPPNPANVSINNSSANSFSSSNSFDSNIAANRSNTAFPATRSTGAAHERSVNTSPNAPKAAFKKIWVDYNVTQEGQKGMRIHTNFSLTNMKDVDSYLAIYFQMRDGTPIQDINQKLYSTDGTVAVYRLLKPGFDVTDYKDLSVFMPYEELDLDIGKYNLRMDVDVIYKAGGLIQHLTYHNFDYTETVKR
jgi:hypothetical protein